MAFVVLSAFGVVYITASYLGFIDQILGRGITVQATLPTSGGLYEGGQVSYRGVQIGKISDMTATDDGVTRRAEARGGHQAPRWTRRCSCTTCRPWASSTSTSSRPPTRAPTPRTVIVLKGSASSLPVDEADLLVELDSFVSSVDKENLQIVVKELGAMFEGTGPPLQNLLDNGARFVDEAAAHTDETIALLDNGLTVLRTQQGQRREHPLLLPRPAPDHRHPA